MNHQKSLYDFTFEELDRELIARGAPKIKEGGIEFHNPGWTQEQNEIMERVEKLYQSAPPPNGELRRFSDNDLAKRLKELSRGQVKEDTEDKHKKGIIADDDRMDSYELEEVIRNAANTTKAGTGKFNITPKDSEYLKDIADLENFKKIKKNLDSTAAICFADGLKVENGFTSLEVRSFKQMYNLCECERFSNQPIANAQMCTCFLVKEDVVATAGHFLAGGKIEDLRILFGFKMENSSSAVTKIPIENIYNAAKVIGLSYDRDGNAPDWALVKLACPVKGREIVKLSGDDIYHGQSIYTIGHPAGLPQKFAAGASVRETRDNKSEFLFKADLDIFMGNSGSPVFDMNTHEVIGIAVQGFSKDFRLVDGCWVSFIYPTPGENTELSKCTGISVFRESL